jgi:ABC-2 type transport system permease protein
MNAFNITFKDLQVFLRDRSAVVMLFLMPFIFIVALAAIGRNVDFSEVASLTEKLDLVVVNLDPNGIAAQKFIATLKNSEIVKPIFQEQAVTENQLNQSALRYALFIPSNFSADLDASRQVSLRLAMHPLAEETSLMTVERAVSRATREYLMVEYLNKGLQQMGEMQAADPQAADAFSMQRIQAQVNEQQAQAAQRPLITVIQTTAGQKEATDVTLPGLGEITVLGMAVLFIFLSAQNTAMSIFNEKKLGSFRRLMAAPISKAALLAGKLLPNLILCLVQLAVILITGTFILQLLGLKPINLGPDWIGVVVVAVAVALCSTSLGILIIAIARTEGQIGGLSSVLVFVAGILSGSFIPLFLFPEGLVNIVRFLPLYWANQAFYGMAFRGQTLVDLWPNVIALLVFTVVFFGIGLWRFKFD